MVGAILSWRRGTSVRSGRGHESGTSKQTVSSHYDDFRRRAGLRIIIAAQITSPRRLRHRRRFRTGVLLMGVEMTNNTELGMPVQIAVPLLDNDAIRTDAQPVRHGWVSTAVFPIPCPSALLQAFCHVQHLKMQGVKYPTPFIWTRRRTTAGSRQHARKFAAQNVRDEICPYLFYE